MPTPNVPSGDALDNSQAFGVLFEEPKFLVIRWRRSEEGFRILLLGLEFGLVGLHCAPPFKVVLVSVREVGARGMVQTCLNNVKRR